MAEPLDMSGVFAKAASDKASGKLRYTANGSPYSIPSYSDLEGERQAYAAGAEARRATELGQRMQQMNAVDAQQGKALSFPDAGMPKPGTFEAPTDFRTPIKGPPAVPRFALPELPNIPAGASGTAEKFAGQAARVAAPLTRVLGPISDLAGAAQALGTAFNSAKSLPGYLQDALAAGDNREKLKALRRERLKEDPSQLTLADEAMGLGPKKKSSNLPDHLEPRGQRANPQPLGTPGVTYLVTIEEQFVPQPSPITGQFTVTAPFSIQERANGELIGYVLQGQGGEVGVGAASSELTIIAPHIVSAVSLDGQHTATPEPQRQGDPPSIPLTVPAFDPSDIPTSAPQPKPRATPAPNQAPQRAADPDPAPRREPSRAPSPAPSSSPSPAPANQAQPTPAPEAQPQSTPGQSPSPGGAGGSLRSPSLNPDKFPDNKIGNQNEPLRSPSLNPDKFPDPAPSQQPDPRNPESPSKSPSPTIDPSAKPTPDAKAPSPPQAPRQCDDPCIAEMQAQQDKNKPVEIKVKVFKACKTAADNKPATTGTTSDASAMDDNATYEEKTIKVPAQEADNYKLLYARLAKLEALQCSTTSAIASVPEWWQLRAEAQRPQLVVIFAEILGTGKLTDSRWSLTIPHYNRPKGFKPRIPDYNKGNFEGILTLTDNSKIIVNASSEMECKRIINALKILVDPKYRTQNGKAIKAKYGERVNSDFKKCKVTPIRADFYSTGARNMQPDFSVNMRTKK